MGVTLQCPGDERVASSRVRFEMATAKADILAKLREQMFFLRSSVRASYEGNFAESVRIATTIRVLVHATGRSKPLLVFGAIPNARQFFGEREL